MHIYIHASINLAGDKLRLEPG